MSDTNVNEALRLLVDGVEKAHIAEQVKVEDTVAAPKKKNKDVLYEEAQDLALQMKIDSGLTAKSTVTEIKQFLQKKDDLVEKVCMLANENRAENEPRHSRAEFVDWSPAKLMDFIEKKGKKDTKVQIQELWEANGGEILFDCGQAAVGIIELATDNERFREKTGVSLNGYAECREKERQIMVPSYQKMLDLYCQDYEEMMGPHWVIGAYELKAFMRVIKENKKKPQEEKA